jgi:glutathione S-transferase
MACISDLGCESLYTLCNDRSSQCIGQGPYYGQATWFARFHPEKLQSAIDRYTNEIERVISVLEIGLERNGSGWLVGDKCTFADLAFVTWNLVGEGLLAELGRSQGLEEKYPRYAEWTKRLEERDEVCSIKERMAQGRAEHGLK